MKIFLLMAGFIFLYCCIGFEIFLLHTMINKGEDDGLDCPSYVVAWPFILALAIIIFPLCALDQAGKKIQKIIRERNEAKENKR